MHLHAPFRNIIQTKITYYYYRVLRHIYISIIAIILIIGRRNLRLNRTCVILCTFKARSLISLRGRRDGRWGEEREEGAELTG